MDEIKHLVFIGFELIAAVIVLTMVFFGLDQSREILDIGITSATDINKVINLEFSQTVFSESGKSLPGSACYVLLASHSDIINKCECTVCGTTTDNASCLKNHLTGRVKLAMTDNRDGTYNIKITG